MSSHSTSKICECPHCGKSIKVEALIEMRVNEVEEGNIDWRQAMSEEELSILKIAEENDILKKFSEVVHIIKASRSEMVPRDMGKHFLSFIRTSVPRQIPRYALNILLKEINNRNEKGGKVDFFCGQSIGMATIEGKFLFFIPEELVIGRRLKGAKGIRTPIKEEEITDWFRSRTGFLEKSIGNYSKWRAKTLKSYADKRQSN